MTSTSPEPLSTNRGRLYVLIATLLWSFSGAFTKVLREPSILDLNDPPIESPQLACFRTLFAASVLLLAVRRGSVSFHPLMLLMAGCFALMNFLFVSAISYGSAANAILLQYTAPMWAFLACVWLLKEPADRRSLVALLIGIVGIGVIITGGWQESQLDVIAMGLGSGLAYAVVLICLRVLRNANPVWLTVLNFLVSGVLLLPLVLPIHPRPTAGQWVVIFLYGAVQMGIPYLLMTRALRTISPQEAGTIGLLEPLLNPLWAFVVVGEAPSVWAFAGGAFILGALTWRYWPRRPLPHETRSSDLSEPERQRG